MAETNQAFVLQSIKKFAYEDRTIPQLRTQRDVRVRVDQTGICGSDIHYWAHGHIGEYVVRKPHILGHESAGVVVEVGSDVTHVKLGDRVAIEPSIPCRHCDFCRSGAYYLCEDCIFSAAPPFDGTLQKYFIVAGDYCYPLPDSMSAEDGALCEPLAVAVQACKTADLRGGQTVLVLGCGSIGALCQAVAKAYGASKVFGVDLSPFRCDFAKGFGADQVFVSQAKPASGEPGEDKMDPARRYAEELLKNFGIERGADVVLECTGAELCIQAGIFATAKGGTYVQVGSGSNSVAMPMLDILIRALTIKGTIKYSTGCYPEAVELISSGKIKAGTMVSHRFKFEEAEKAFEAVGKDGVMKVMIEGVQG